VAKIGSVEKGDEPARASPELMRAREAVTLAFLRKSIGSRIPATTELGAVGALFVIGLVLSLLSPYFLTASNLLNITRQISIIGIIAVGMTYTILIGGIDLSVGSTFALTGCLMALLMQNGVHPAAAILVGLVAGVVVGSMSGLLVTQLDMPPFVATLGMMSFLRGMALTITNGWPISLLDVSKQFPILFQLGQGKIGPIPTQAVAMVAVMILFGLILSSTPFGYEVYAVGGNQRAAMLSGVNVKRVKIMVFGLSGLLSAFAGVLGIMYVTGMEPMIGMGYELDAIAAAVIGGTSLAGGSGTILGTFLGACIMGVLYNGLVLLGVSPFMQQTFIGLVVIAAVGLGGGLTRRPR
jgi:ribose transport system permease protein